MPIRLRMLKWLQSELGTGDCFVSTSRRVDLFQPIRDEVGAGLSIIRQHVGPVAQVARAHP